MIYMRMHVGKNSGDDIIDFIETNLEVLHYLAFDYDIHRLVLKLKFDDTELMGKLEEFMNKQFEYPYEYEVHNDNTNERYIKQRGEGSKAMLTAYLLPLFPASAVWEHTRLNIKEDKV